MEKHNRKHLCEIETMRKLQNFIFLLLKTFSYSECAKKLNLIRGEITIFFKLFKILFIKFLFTAIEISYQKQKIVYDFTIYRKTLCRFIIKVYEYTVIKVGQYNLKIGGVMNFWKKNAKFSRFSVIIIWSRNTKFHFICILFF